MALATTRAAEVALGWIEFRHNLERQKAQVSAWTNTQDCRLPHLSLAVPLTSALEQYFLTLAAPLSALLDLFAWLSVFFALVAEM